MKKLIIILSFILSGLLMYSCSSGHIYSSSRPYSGGYYYNADPYYYGPPVYHYNLGVNHGWVDGHHYNNHHNSH
ncbi:MAG: hypothetical protein K2X86_09310 [Cytophagaceae bacterium]|nr:hypothetical protein [Cytophagaceae bacterium]